MTNFASINEIHRFLYKIVLSHETNGVANKIKFNNVTNYLQNIFVKSPDLNNFSESAKLNLIKQKTVIKKIEKLLLILIVPNLRKIDTLNVVIDLANCIYIVMF